VKRKVEQASRDGGRKTRKRDALNKSCCDLRSEQSTGKDPVKKKKKNIRFHLEKRKREENSRMRLMGVKDMEEISGNHLESGKRGLGIGRIASAFSGLLLRRGE